MRQEKGVISTGQSEWRNLRLNQESYISAEARHRQANKNSNIQIKKEFVDSHKISPDGSTIFNEKVGIPINKKFY